MKLVFNPRQLLEPCKIWNHAKILWTHEPKHPRHQQTHATHAI